MSVKLDRICQKCFKSTINQAGFPKSFENQSINQAGLPKRFESQSINQAGLPKRFKDQSNNRAGLPKRFKNQSINQAGFPNRFDEQSINQAGLKINQSIGQVCQKVKRAQAGKRHKATCNTSSHNNNLSTLYRVPSNQR